MNRKESIGEWIAAFFMVAFSIIGVIIALLLLAGVFTAFIGIGELVAHVMSNFGIYIIGFFLFVVPAIDWIYGLFKEKKQ